jgi:hypothetical protein
VHHFEFSFALGHVRRLSRATPPRRGTRGRPLGRPPHGSGPGKEPRIYPGKTGLASAHLRAANWIVL